MNIKAFGFLLLALFLISSLEAVWANEFIDIEELAELDGALAANGEVEENGFSILSKHICKERSVHYGGGRCIKSKCRHLCKNDGYKKGKCVRSKSDELKKCYCYKHCDDSQVPIAISPAISPSSAPANNFPSDIPPSSAPANNFPSDFPPSSAPADNFPSDIPPSSTPLDIAPANFPSDIPPSSAPVNAAADFTPSSAPANFYFEDEESDITYA